MRLIFCDNGQCEIILTKDKYDELKKMGYMPESIVCSVRLQEKTDVLEYPGEAPQSDLFFWFGAPTAIQQL